MCQLYFFYLHPLILTRCHQQNHHHFAGKQAVSARHYPHPDSAGKEVEMTDATMGERPGDSLFTSEKAVQV